MKSKLLKWGAGVGIAAVIGYQFIPDETLAPVDSAGSGVAVTIIHDNKPGGREIPFDQTTAEVSWTALKQVAGKGVTVSGGWDQDGKISGRLMLGADGAPARIEAEVRILPMWTEHQILTDIMGTCGLFEAATHPTASFVSSAITPGVDAGVLMSNATHTVTGNLSINGVTRSLRFPVRLRLDGGTFRFESEFGLKRHEFNSRLLRSPAGSVFTDGDIDPNVTVRIRVGAADNTTAVTKAAAFDRANLPKQFTETIPATQVPFTMVLVPGDEAAGIAPFYAGAGEVSWDEFLPYVYCQDLTDPVAQGKERSKKLRPSLPYGVISRNFPTEGYPALGISRLNAMRYCDWLSRQTGRTYRLPTDREWEHMFKLGGQGVEVPAANAWANYEDTSWDETDWPDYKPRAVLAPPANALGLHHLIGNMAEWVVPADGRRIVRGGHFKGPATALGGTLEEPESWNAGYPNFPVTEWWFVDAYWVGFRVVCDP